MQENIKLRNIPGIQSNKKERQREKEEEGRHKERNLKEK